MMHFFLSRMNAICEYLKGMQQGSLVDLSFLSEREYAIPLFREDEYK